MSASGVESNDSRRNKIATSLLTNPNCTGGSVHVHVNMLLHRSSPVIRYQFMIHFGISFCVLVRVKGLFSPDPSFQHCRWWS
jgi:hypothetical protein